MKSVKGLMGAAKGTAFSVWKSANEAVLPAQSSSTFDLHGRLTPEEFTAAGDFLVRTYPTWKWEQGDPAKAKGHLPDPKKQYLITRNVPCHERAAAITAAGDAAEIIVPGGDDDGEGWVATGGGGLTDGGGSHAEEDIPDLNEDELKSSQVDYDNDDDDDDDDIPDMDALEIEDESDDEAALAQAAVAGQGSDHIVRSRTYDILVTYDKYHAVPKTWLVGYDEDRRPLTPKQIFEDISENYAKKTATVETFPHSSMPAVGIHPCKHAETMRRLADVSVAGGGAPLQAEQYMVLFLKFIASVVPTVEYDFTSAAGGP